LERKAAGWPRESDRPWLKMRLWLKVGLKIALRIAPRID